MKSTLISKENNAAKFSIEFTAEEFEAAIVKVYQAQKGKFVVDGFRKGKAPRSIIEKKYGEGIFFEDAIDNLISSAYPAALEELNLDAIGQPTADFSDIKKGEGFTVTIEVECLPEFEVKDYKGVEIEAVSADVTDEDVDNEIQNLAKRNSRMVEVDRAAQDGDTVVLDYAGFVGDEQFEGGTAERQSLKLGSGTFIPGFEEQLVGANKGEETEVKVTFPEEYHAEELAGKEAVFKCTVHEIKEEEIPAIDDEFVKDVSEFDTLDEMKADTREKLEKAAAARAENEMKSNVLEKVFEANDIDVPNVMIENEQDNMMAEFDQQLKQQGLDMNTYFQYIGKDAKEFRDEIKEDALKRVKTRLIVNKIAEQEGFEVTDEDMNEELEKMAQQYGLESDKLREMLGVEGAGMMAGDIKVRKALDFIYENAVKK